MGRRILVADDSSTIQKVIKIAFARFAVEIIEAGSFIETLAALGRTSPDALIIDASLPGARGPADYAKLSADANGAPLLLLVGTYEAVDEEAFRQAGFQNFLKKPFESGDIVSVLDRLLGGELAAAARGRTAGGGPIVPPLPGSANRAQHATVIHTGGFDPLAGHTVPPPPLGRGQSSAGPLELSDDDLDGDLDSDLPPGLVPPPPLVDQERKGRRAFDGAPGRPSAGGGEPRLPPEPRSYGLPTPPPVSLSFAFGDDGEATSGGLPESIRGLDGEEASGRRGGPGRERERDRDRDRDSSEITASRRPPTPLPPLPTAGGLGQPPTAGGLGQPPAADDGLELSLGDAGGYAPSQVQARPPVGRPQGKHDGKQDGTLDELRTALNEQLPALVRQAVEEYCERHFKSLAREIISSELRRLADEKARHLVDN